MKKLRINMFARGENVPGQGVGSAYHEQLALLRQYASDALEVVENSPEDGDVNHFNTVDPMSYLRCRRSKAPTVMHVHFLPDTLEGSIKLPPPAFRVFKSYVMSFYNKADHLVVVNPTFIAELAQYGLDAAKVTYIPNFVSRDEFHPLPKEETLPLREKLGIPAGKFIVVGVGQVQTRKGVLDFIRTAEMLPEIQFVWCGGFSFGKITDGYQDLKAKVEAPPPNVIFAGIVPREDMNRYYNLADCLFLPSFNELFPMSILEASNVHLPILVRNLDLYRHILFSHHLSAEDAEGFAAEIQKLAEDPSYRKHWTEESAEIEIFYSAEHVSSLWVDFYRRVAKSAPGSKKF